MASSSPPDVDFASPRVCRAEAGGCNDAEAGCRHGRGRQAAEDDHGVKPECLAPAHRRRDEELRSPEEGRVRVETGLAVAGGAALERRTRGEGGAPSARVATPLPGRGCGLAGKKLDARARGERAELGAAREGFPIAGMMR